MDEAALIEELARALAVADRIEICSDAQYRHSSYGIRATALLPILRRVHNEAVEKAAKVADELGGDRIARNADGSLRSYDMESKHGRGDAMLNGMRVRAQTIATAIRTLRITDHA